MYQSAGTEKTNNAGILYSAGDSALIKRSLSFFTSLNIITPPF